MRLHFSPAFSSGTLLLQQANTANNLNTQPSSRSKDPLERLVSLHEESVEMQRKSMAWQAEMIERQNAMGIGSGVKFWWNRLMTNASVSLPLGFISGAVTGAVLPFFAKLMGGIT